MCLSCRDELHFEHDPAFLDSLLEGAANLDANTHAALDPAAPFAAGATTDDGSLTWDELMAGLDDLPHMWVWRPAFHSIVQL